MTAEFTGSGNVWTLLRGLKPGGWDFRFAISNLEGRSSDIIKSFTLPEVEKPKDPVSKKDLTWPTGPEPTLGIPFDSPGQGGAEPTPDDGQGGQVGEGGQGGQDAPG